MHVPRIIIRPVSATRASPREVLDCQDGRVWLWRDLLPPRVLLLRCLRHAACSRSRLDSRGNRLIFYLTWLVPLGKSCLESAYRPTKAGGSPLLNQAMD